MQSNTPLWIKEILDNDDLISKYRQISPGKFVVMPGKSLGVAKSAGLHTRVAFFRDGPFLPISTGAANSIYWMMNALADIGVDVYLFYSYRGWAARSLFKGQKFTTVFISPDDFYTDKKVMGKILTDLDINICHFDSAEAVCLQKRLLPIGCKAVFEVHNIESDLVRQIGLSKGVANKIESKEIKAFKMADAVLVRSNSNYQEAMGMKCDKSKLFNYRGGINTDSIDYLKRGVLSHNKILFLGHLNYKPNQQAVEVIAKKIAPRSNKTFIIAGKGAPALKEKYESKNVKFIGWVKDLNKLFSKVDLALAPITTGSGTRIKVLDYMAAGIPVIGTNIAIEGLEDKIKKFMVVEDDFEKYANIIGSFYSSPLMVEKLSVRGRNFVFKNRNWKYCINDVMKAYKFVLKS